MAPPNCLGDLDCIQIRKLTIQQDAVIGRHGELSQGVSSTEGLFAHLISASWSFDQGTPKESISARNQNPLSQNIR
jgi:hypothetical protein